MAQVVQWRFFVASPAYLSLSLPPSLSLGSTLAETGCYAILSNVFSDHLGKIMAACELCTGAGAMLGPFFGGVIYHALQDFGVDAQFQVQVQV